MATAQRHLDWCLALVEAAAAQLESPEALSWFARLEAEHANLRAAWAWAQEHTDSRMIFRLIRPLFAFWMRQGWWKEGAEWMQTLLARLPTDAEPERALTLVACATFLARSGRIAEAGTLMQAGYALAQQVEDPTVLGIASLGISQMLPQAEQRQQLLQQAVTLLRQADARAFLTNALWLWGDELREQGAVALARGAYTESLHLYRAMGQGSEAVYPLGNLGRLALLEGNVAGARATFADCVALARRSGSQVALADWLLRLGAASFYLGALGPARQALEEALGLAQEMAHQHIVANLQTWLAQVALQEGDVVRAEGFLHQSLNAYAQMLAITGDEPPRAMGYPLRAELVEALVALAELHVARGQGEQGVRVLSLVGRFAREHPYPLDPPLQGMRDGLRERLLRQIGYSRFSVVWVEGQSLTLEDTMRLGVDKADLAEL